jgi:hypothetical protein
MTESKLEKRILKRRVFPQGPAAYFNENYSDKNISWMELRHIDPGLARTLLRYGEKEKVFPSFRGYTPENRKEILSSHEYYKGNSVQAGIIMGYPRRTIAKMWKEAGLPSCKDMQKIKNKKKDTKIITKSNSIRSFSPQYNFIKMLFSKEEEILEEKVYLGDDFLFELGHKRHSYLIKQGWKIEKFNIEWNYSIIVDKKPIETGGYCTISSDIPYLFVENTFKKIKDIKFKFDVYPPKKNSLLDCLNEQSSFPDSGEVLLFPYLSYLSFKKNEGILFVE